MSEPKTPLVEIYEAFDRVRGEKADAAWAFSVSWALLMRGIDSEQVRQGLLEALEVVGATRESPEDLFGTARDYADSIYEQWRSEGRLVFAAQDVPTWRRALLVGIVLSAAYLVIFSVLLLLRDGTVAGMLLRGVVISVLIGLGTSFGQALWTRRHRPPRRIEATHGSLEYRWSAELTEILRGRYSMSGARVSDIVTDAHVHAAESGSTVQREFGTPEEYAAHFTPDLTRRSRLNTLALALLALAACVLMLDGFSWSGAALMAIFAWRATLEYLTYTSLRAIVRD